jgi:hypothetical protein
MSTENSVIAVYQTHSDAAPDERTADGDAVRHDIEERNWEFAWRQPD